MKIKDEIGMVGFGRKLAEECRRGFGGSGGADVVGSSGTADDLGGAMVIELVGDVGAGKTTLTRGLAEGLGVSEPVTSPSFTISKAYALPGGGRLVHYDFYRLSDPGLMVEDLAENLADPANVVVIEWGESVADLLPEGHLKIEIVYAENGEREIKIVSGVWRFRDIIGLSL